MKTCKNCEWAGYCTFDDNAVMCERDGSEYIPADKVVEEAETCLDYCEVKKMKCKYCNGTGYNNTQRGTVMTEFPPCPWCGGSGYVKDKEQTNEEWFCGLSTEEKAETIANATYSSAMMGAEITALPKEEEVRKWKMWLKQPHTTKE